MAGNGTKAGKDGLHGVDLTNTSQEVPSLKDHVSDAEWTARCELAATYRIIALMGWDDLVFTHISMRLPDEDGEPRFLINPYGLFFEEMTASSLLKIDISGNKTVESPYSPNHAGFIIHSAVHAARHDALCVIHLHTQHGIAVSAQKAGLLRLSQFAMQVHDDTAYHDYEGIALHEEEQARMVAALGEKSCLILRNHGTLTMGGSCGAAFLRMYWLERACQVQIAAQAGGAGGVHIETPELSALVAQQTMPAFVPGLGDRLLWPGLIRRLARHYPGWDQ